ncbi:MAG TPA: AAA family ATPase, partial [Asanoa sp.]|nr:AAA family ATPase [Asanoa sp.]
MNDVTAAAFGLFGREDALQVMSDVLVRGGSAVVVGDPGVGKSSLLKVTDQLAQRRGRRVLSVTPTQFERGLPFAGLTEMISQCPEGADRRLPDPQRRALAVALRHVDPDGREVDALAVPLAVRGLLTLLCEAEPVALIIDDLQWLDLASVGSLAFALRRLPVEPQRLSVLVGTRPEGANSDLIRSLAEPRHEVSLPPLEGWALGQLLRNRLGPRWTPPMSDGVARASSGNPFLALMIAQAMQSDVSKWRWSAQQGHEPVFPVPPSLAGLLGEKVSLLPQSAREVLLLVSAAGRLTVAQLEEISKGGAQVRSALEAAADWDVATVGAGSIVAFTHPMLASAIYDGATPPERRRVHRMLAERLDDPVERARHRSRTITAPDEAVARELEQAADISRSRGAQQLAGELMEAAALATPSQLDNRAGVERLLRSADAFSGGGDLIGAGSALGKASPLATSPEDQAQVMARQVWLADQHLGMRALAEQAERLAPRGSTAWVEIVYSLGAIHRMEGNEVEARRLMRLAVIEAAEVGRPDLQLLALNELLATERLWGHSEAGETLREVQRLVESGAPDLPSARIAWTRGFFAAWDDQTAEGHVRNGIRTAVDAGRYGDLSNLYITLVLV